MDFCQRKEAVTRKFIELYGQPPTLWGRAPGRVDLMGSHTDYNMGFVMTMTIDRDTWMAAAPRDDGYVAVQSLNAEGGGTFALENPEHDSAWPWTNYIRGMAWALAAEDHPLMAENHSPGAAGLPLRGWNGLVHSTVPFGSGLSSSAAMEMAASVIFQQAGGFSLDPVRMALLGQKAENQFVGVNCGILDQYSSALGQAGCALLLDCRYLTSRAVPLAPGIQVVICDTRAERNLAGTEYGERRAQCEEGVRILQRDLSHVRALRDISPEEFARWAQALPPLVARRCRFIVEENQRVLQLAGALATGDRAALRKLFAESYAGARDLYEIGAPAMEWMMQAMLGAPGVIGARQAGAGFGGCMVALVEQAEVEAFTQSVREQYARLAGIRPDVYPVKPSDGAGILASG